MSTTSVEKKDSKASQTGEGEGDETEKKSKASSDSLMGFAFGGEESSTEEEEQTVAVEEVRDRSTFFNQKYIKTTYAEYKREELKKEPLFTEVLTLEKDTAEIKSEKKSVEEPSILVTGFGIRNLESMQNALREEQRRLLELYGEGGMEEGSSLSSVSSKRLVTPLSRSSETETDRSSLKTDLSAQRLQLQYLLGLEAETEEEHVEEEKVEEEAEEEFIYSTSKSTKAAQKYLRVHRIFDFFQVIIAHLLSALPDNPIDFILIYLNKCLCYRSGLGRPPLLYEQKHIAQLYRLMDRMDTGFIELEQYDKAMATLGICEYNKNPPLSEEGLVSREYYIQEALESETAIFDDLIRRRWIGKKPPSEPRSLRYLHRTDSGPYFIPSDLLLKLRPYQLHDLDMIVEGEEDHGMGFMCEPEGE